MVSILQQILVFGSADTDCCMRRIPVGSKASPHIPGISTNKETRQQLLLSAKRNKAFQSLSNQTVCLMVKFKKLKSIVRRLQCT